MFTIEHDNLDDLIQMTGEEAPQRVKAVLRDFTLILAEFTLKTILARIPSTPENGLYRAALGVARVTGQDMGTAAHAVRVDKRSRKVTQVDAAKVVLYIRRRRKARKVSPEVVVLENYNPWTMDTLPFMPKRTEVRVISRVLSEGEVKKISEDRQQDAPKWKRDLAQVGVRNFRKRRSPGFQTVPDVAFEALRLEFGLGGRQARPHWRPAIQAAKGIGLKKATSHPRVERTLTDPEYRDWVIPLQAPTIPSTEAKQFEKFIKTLGF